MHSHYIVTEAVKEAVKVWLEGQTEDFYCSGINSLPEKCRTCIELGDKYIEKLVCNIPFFFKVPRRLMSRRVTP